MNVFFRLKSALNPVMLVLRGLFVSVLFTMISCEYSPSGESFQNIDEPIAEQANVQLNFDDSVIVTNGTSYLTYDISFMQLEVEKVECYLDNEQIYSSGSKVGEIRLSYQNIRSGSYNFEMKIYASSNNGSVADQLGAEQYVYTNEWTLVMTGGPPPELNITNISIVDGQLKVEWERYDNFNFDRYEVLKNGQEIYSTEDINTTSYSDPLYVGGVVTYQLKLWAGSWNNVGEEKSYNTYGDSISASVDSSYGAHISWTKCQLSESFSHYMIYSQYKENGTTTRKKLAHITDINDTSIVLPWGLNINRKVLVRYCNSASQDTYYDWGAFEKDCNINAGIWRGESWNVTQSMFPPYHIYSVHYDRSYKINTEENTASYYPTIAWGSLAVAPDNSRLVSGKLVMDPSDMSQLDYYDFLEVNNEFGSYTTDISLSNSGLSAITTPYNHFLYNFSNKEYVHSFDDNFFYVTKISPNGKYVIALKRNEPGMLFFETNGTDVELKKTVLKFYKNIFFLGDTTKSEFIVMNSDQLEHWSCDNLTLIKSTTLDIDKILAYDPVSQTFIAMKDQNLYIYDISNFELIHSLTFDEALYPIDNKIDDVAYLNNILLFEGYSFKITL